MRPLCENCGQSLAKRGKALCDGCYDLGVHKARQRVKRPKARELLDTGLRVDNRFNELVHEDGTREFPVPGELIFSHYLGRPQSDGLLPVLRVTTRLTVKGEANASHQPE